MTWQHLSADVLLHYHYSFCYWHWQWLILYLAFPLLHARGLHRKQLNKHLHSPQWKRAARSIPSPLRNSCGFFLRICARRLKKASKRSPWSDKLPPGVLVLPLQAIMVMEHSSLRRDSIRGNWDLSLPYITRNCKGKEQIKKQLHFVSYLGIGDVYG